MSVGGELLRLLELGEYRACLEQGRSLLEEGELPEDERARVLSVLCRCHLALEEWSGAAAAGGIAAALARRLGLSDLEGAALVNQARALTRLRRHGEALAALERYRTGLLGYTAARVLEGTALQQTALALAGQGRAEEAVRWFERARRWFNRFGDEASAGDCLLGMIEACLAAAGCQTAAQPDRQARWRAEARRWLREAERHAASRSFTVEFHARVRLVRARLLEAEEAYEASVAEAFQALLLAESVGPVQVEAQLHLSRMAALLGRAVEALSFALAARASSLEGQLFDREFAATAWLVRLIGQFGPEPLDEVADELAKQGVDLYRYIDGAEADRLARGE